ncbi:MAG: hypothetical protein WBF58_04705, partial [Xanthobacteraceae bacterium]
MAHAAEPALALRFLFAPRVFRQASRKNLTAKSKKPIVVRSIRQWRAGTITIGRGARSQIRATKSFRLDSGNKKEAERRKALFHQPPHLAVRRCPHPDPPPLAGEGMGGGSTP